MLLSNRGPRLKIEEMERKYDSQFDVLFDAIKASTGVRKAQKADVFHRQKKKLISHF